MDKAIKQLKKLETLQKEPNLAFFDEFEALNGKLKAIKGVLNEINVKEVKTYEKELETLVSGLYGLTEVFKSKDMVVNVESNLKELDKINLTLNDILKQFKKEQSVNVKLVIR